jgi:hypothetical protein
MKCSGAHLPVTDFMALQELQPPRNQQATTQTVSVKETALGPEHSPLCTKAADGCRW